MENIKIVLKWVVGALAFLGIGLLTITTLNKFGSSKLINQVLEWAFLKSKDIKRKDDILETPVGDIKIPESVTGTVVAIDTEEGYTEDEGEILHTPEDRRNVQYIKQNAKERLNN